MAIRQLPDQLINQIAAAGITNGCGTRAFCPSQSITRGEMAMFMSRGFGSSVPEVSEVTFDDAAGHVYEEAIDWMGSTGISNGCNGDASSYCPNDDAPRDHLAVFVYRAMIFSGRGG